VTVVPVEEVKSEIKNVADLERQVGRVMTKVKPHYTPEIDD
jgi:phage host-nuclease inhibitor protein Gam